MRHIWFVPVWLVTTWATADPAPPPWLVSFTNQKGDVVCGGALVGAEEEPGLGLADRLARCRLTMLTAQHCLVPTIPMCVAIGKRVDSCSSPDALAMRSFAGNVRVGDTISMIGGDLILVRLKVAGNCSGFKPLETRPCRADEPLELWTWLHGAPLRRENVAPASACPSAPGAGGGPATGPDCPRDWLRFEDAPVTDSECHWLGATAQPHESGGVLVCAANGRHALAGILSQSCAGVGSFVRDWHPPAVDLADRGSDLTLREALSRARACGLVMSCAGTLGPGGNLRLGNER